MPYHKPDQGEPSKCNVCGSPANVRRDGGFYVFIDCSRCGDFQLGRAIADDFPQTKPSEKKVALASHLIRRLHQGSKRVVLDDEFFSSLSERTLPTPTELCDNLLLWFSEKAYGRVGKVVGAGKTLSDLDLVASIGAIDGGDARWTAEALKKSAFMDINTDLPDNGFRGNITPAGWNRVEEPHRAHVASRYAFFARKFANTDLDTLYVVGRLKTRRLVPTDMR